MLPSFGSFGRKSAGLATAVIPGGGSGSASKKERERERERDRRGGSRMALHSEEEDDDEEMLYTGNANNNSRNRNRSGSTLSASVSRMSLATNDSANAGPPPRMRRTNTAPVNMSARYMRAKHDYPGGAADELPLRVGQVIEVKSEVNGDWYIGESEGMSGLFPASYCDEYKPNPVTSGAPAPAPRRSMPPGPGSGSLSGLAPPISQRTPSPSGFDAPSDTDFDSHGFEDADHYATAALSSAPQANPTSRTASPLPMPKKKAPPPPPSRRSQSSSNILASASASTSSSSVYLSPPQPNRPRANTGATITPYAQQAPEASPFGGSEDEAEAEYLDHQSPSGSGGQRNGLGAMHLGLGRTAHPQTDVDECNICGCDDFTQNAFKPPGTCSTCFHNHI